MVKSRALVCLLVVSGIFSGLSYAVSASADRITGDLTSGTKIQLKGNVHGLARPEFDLGRADGSRMLHVVSLSFHPSAAQQQDLDLFLSQLSDRSSPNYHKYMTPAQFADRFGMTQNDINKVVAWLQSEGFINITVSNSRNQVSFDGTVAQVESTFALEMHNYLVNGEVHLANAGEPSVPAALAASVLSVGHLHDFSPKPRMKAQPHLTSYLSGNHYLSPGDYATIYNVTALYTAGDTGSNQKIAVIGQSTVATSDLNNFRSAAQLPASTVTMNWQLVAGTTQPVPTPTRCSGDEGESDLDLEWSGGVAKSASITFVFAPLSSGDTCASRQGLNVWNALQAAIDNNVAPFISTSYGYCEAGLGLTEANTIRGWAVQGVAQGQTITASSGDSGAADCDTGSPATQGLAVDVPASIPEVTGAGGNEFVGDTAGAVTGNEAAADPPYWSASGAGSDTISSALEYIPEEAWNDTAASVAAGGGLAASGGGASSFFSKPTTWQTGTGVPADGKRDVPDISVSTSPDHDGYLVCSEDGANGAIVATCTNGFRDASTDFDVVGGTSAAAPTFTAVMALINQYLGNVSPTGLAPINPVLYQLAAGTPNPFHDVTAGNNIVPCQTGTANCTTGSMGFSAGVGYDQVTGLGSPNANALAQAWAATIAEFTVTAGALSPVSVAAGSSTTSTITVTALTNNGTTFTGTVSFSCSGLPTGATCTFNPPNVSVPASTTTQLTIATPANLAASTTPVTVKGVSGAVSATATVSLAVTATTQTFSLSSPSAGGTLSVAQGQVTGAVNITVISSSVPSFVISSGSGQQTALPITYTCSGLPTASTCMFSPGTANTATTSSTTLTLTIQTTAPTAKLQRPLDRGTRIFYAVLLPGLFGIVFMFSGRRRSFAAGRMLALLMVLGLSTVWMASCGGTSGGGSNSNPGTPIGSYPITVNATTGGASPLTPTTPLTFTLSVTQ
ncbi:MAG: protease pro-enzyme activation domain-containing protein [Candidatus Sulfotelmatobacter sp.]